MPEHQTIGEFSRMSGLTVKALRHYDRMGVLRPAHVDPRTGYRYYHAAQLDTAVELRALIGLGIPLTRIAQLLAERSPRAWRAALLAARTALRRRVAADVERLSAIDARLARLARGGPDPSHSPFLSCQAGQLVAAMRRDLPSFDEIGPLLGEVGGAVSGAAACGFVTPGVIWHDCGKLTGRIDCEGLVLLEDAPPPATRSRVRLRRLPPVSTACVVHYGSDTAISPAYAAVERWAAEHGYRPAGPIREWYLEGRADGPDAVTEIHLPIARGATA